MNFDAIVNAMPCTGVRKAKAKPFAKGKKKAKGNKSIMELTGLISRRVSTACRLPGGKMFRK